MSCCVASEAALVAVSRTEDEELRLASRAIGGGVRQSDIAVPTVHCGGCIQSIEKALNVLPGVERARVNLSTKRVSVLWRADAGDRPPPILETLQHLGFEAHLHDAGAEERDGTLSQLIRALAVAGFAASNIMLLSVSVWSGADPATRDIFHAVSAAIALPALAYSGRVFFRSAWSALRHGRTNMDVPISIGVLLAFGLSLYETLHHGQHAYFDASITLLFFLLIGRTLDHVMRERARSAVTGLVRLAARGALVVGDDGNRTYLPVAEIQPGMTVLLAAGERVPVDARVVAGRSEIDFSLVTGESVPQAVKTGDILQAGTLNLTGPLTLTANAAAQDSFLAEVVRMMEAAEGGRSTYRRIADRAARLYAPAVHSLAFLTFIGWMIATGDVHRAITIAIAVLIVTCPCALGLAVPIVQVVAARRLFERGILLKDGGALERLAEIDTIVFDKTGTLTLGTPRLANAGAVDRQALLLAGSIAAHSRHPYSRALAAAGAGPAVDAASVTEIPSSGLEARVDGHLYRLGRAGWALGPGAEAGEGGVVLAEGGRRLAAFTFDDRLRAGAADAVAELQRQGLGVEILSGDSDAAVRAVAERLGTAYAAGVRPGDKTARLATLTASGHRPLMVGDGLNDAPALIAAHASMAPASAADVGRNAADLVFLHESPVAVPQAVAIARSAAGLVRQNLALAVGYNAIAVPIAVLGYATPLVAAIAMSLSSLVVVGNALRLYRSPVRDAGLAAAVPAASLP